MPENNELENQLKSRLTGTPQTKPDERRRYLGSLRERVLLQITVAQLSDPRTLPAFKQAAPQLAATKLLLNGKLAATLKPYLQYASQNNLAFTMVNDEAANTANAAVAVLLVATTAVERSNVDISQYYQAATKSPTKHTFLADLFNGRNIDPK
ncbi:YueI family protein [Loigolactobacillus binensis]|uniref:YueI family protein n=1 Tax=Loigolactobacillus binensis TaxID=2559922 RepID=A0ABW3EC83_9LACO|nr:YueI family protein [Loigolactobacillus binensis]